MPAISVRHAACASLEFSYELATCSRFVRCSITHRLAALGTQMLAQKLVRFAALLAVGWCSSLTLAAAPYGMPNSIHASKAPAFRAKLALAERALTIEFELTESDASFDPRAWVIQLWVADAQMVEARRALLSESRATLEEFRLEQLDSYNQTPDCAQKISSFLTQAKAAQRDIADYDPFLQTAFLFAPQTIATDIESVLLTPDSDPSRYRAEVKLAGRIDLASLQVSTLSYRLEMVPIRPKLARAVTMSELQHLKFNPVWDFTQNLHSDYAVGEPVWAQTPKFVFLSGGEGVYVPSDVAEVRGEACYPVQGIFLAPALWNSVVTPERLLLDAAVAKTKADAGLQVWQFRSQLIYRQVAADRFLVIDPSASISAKGDLQWHLLDARIRGDAAYFLLEVVGEARPNSPMSYCGADYAADLVWIRSSLAGEKNNVVAHPTYSCFSNIDALKSPEFGPVAADTIWRWELSVVRSHGEPGKASTGTRQLEYKPLQPQLGIRVIEP
jgi:hypothetical protein